MKYLTYLFCIALALAAGCEQLNPPKITADLSSPKTAAVAYLEAMQKGDSRMARALSDGTPEQQAWVDGHATLIDGMRKYDEALYAKFGNIVHQAHTDIHDSLTRLADFWVDTISQGSVSSVGDKARIDPKNIGYFTRFVNPVYLKHLKDGWKVDIGQTYAPDLPKEQYGDISAEYRQEHQVGEMFRAVAADVNAGRIHSIEEAGKALGTRLDELQK